VFWNSNYPETVPISHHFRHDYPTRWFRIHSLPESKRYANNEEEWSILLGRQNEIITDLLGGNSDFLLVTGEYAWDGGNTTLDAPLVEVDSVAQTPFISLDKIDLHQLSPAEYDLGTFYHPMFNKQNWMRGKFDDLLRDIANDKLRAFFISIEKELLIAPYDGGVDFVLENTTTRDHYKEKYRDWLSSRQDGL